MSRILSEIIEVSRTGLRKSDEFSNDLKASFSTERVSLPSSYDPMEEYRAELRLWSKFYCHPHNLEKYKRTHLRYIFFELYKEHLYKLKKLMDLISSGEKYEALKLTSEIIKDMEEV